MSEKINGIQDSSEFSEIKIPVPWGHISGKWWGCKVQQPIIAIHGWQDNAGTFDNLAPLLMRKNHSILCIDLPGHGLSSHYPDGAYYYVFWDGIHILRRIVKYFNWSNIVVMGHSLGGGIAFLYAAVYPSEIKTYISFDIASPSVRDPKNLIDLLGPSVDKFLKYETLTLAQMPCYKYDEMIDLVYDAYKGSVTKEFCKIMMKRGMKRVEDTETDKYIFTRDARLKVAALGFMTSDQVMEFAKRIRCNVLNIKGNPGMKFDFPEFYDIILDTISERAKLERHIVNGTHHLHLNNAESVVDIIHNFLIS